MPHFTLQVTGEGPIISAFVGVSAARRKALEEASQPIPGLVLIRALVDTGASLSAMDPSVLDSLRLTPTGSVSVHTPSTGPTPHSTDQYDIALLVPGPEAGSPPLFLGTMPVIAADLLQAQGIHALVGRDVLRHCILIYNGREENFSMAF